ncbi:MAG TPA: hypothetical protein DCE28_00610 [Halomonas sp.]|nr:hypothetical protein [Halomonas sp.]
MPKATDSVADKGQFSSNDVTPRRLGSSLVGSRLSSEPLFAPHIALIGIDIALVKNERLLLHHAARSLPIKELLCPPH